MTGPFDIAICQRSKVLGFEFLEKIVGFEILGKIFLFVFVLDKELVFWVLIFWPR